MGVSDPSFPASQAFDMIGDALSVSDKDRQEAMKKGAAIFAFTLKNSAGKEASWYIDLKKEGKVGRGTAPTGEKANGALRHPTLSNALRIAHN
jgi:hypothetical protein